MQQTAFMLIFLTIFFAMVGLIFMAFWNNSLKKNVNLLEENKAVILSKNLYQSSEFSCQDEYCVDTDKILFLNASKNKNLFPVEYIKVYKIYPSEPEKKCNIVNYPNCNYYDFNFKNTNEIAGQGSFVALCRIEQTEYGFEKICDLGKFVVGYKVK